MMSLAASLAETGGTVLYTGNDRNTAKTNVSALLRISMVTSAEAMMRHALRRIGGDESRRIGQSFSDANRAHFHAAALESRRGARGSINTPSRERTRDVVACRTSDRCIAVPRVGQPARPKLPPPIFTAPRRKTADEIHAAQGERERPPAYVPTVSREEKKDDLATRLQFGGRTPAEVLAGAPPRGRQRALELEQQAEHARHLRDEIADEIMERQAFLEP